MSKGKLIICNIKYGNYDNICKVFASRKCPLMYSMDSSSSWLVPYEYMSHV